jgi:hypothetical protein
MSNSCLNRGRHLPPSPVGSSRARRLPALCAGCNGRIVTARGAELAGADLASPDLASAELPARKSLEASTVQAFRHPDAIEVVLGLNAAIRPALPLVETDGSDVAGQNP